MRVVHVSCYRDPGRRSPTELLQAWPSLTAVARAVAATGLDVRVLQAAHQDAVLEHRGVECHFVAERLGSLSARRRAALRPTRLGARLRQLQPDLVHFHGLSFPLQLRQLQASLDGTPILVQDHADRPPRGLRRALARWGHRCVTGALFTAHAQSDPFLAAGVLQPGLSIMEVPEASSDFTPGDMRDARRATGLYGDPCLLWVGRLDANKDPLCVLDGIAMAVPSLPRLQLWCCFGQAPLLSVVTQRIASDARLQEHVHLLGTVPHSRIETLLRAADYLVLGSHREGSGYAVLEALACGVPPLVPDIPPFRALTGGEPVTTLWPPGNPSALANALTWRAGGDRTAQRRTALRHFQRQLAFPALGERLRRIYTSLEGAR